MENVEKLFTHILAKTVCGCSNCEECMAIFETEECPCETVDRNDAGELAKDIYTRMKDRKYYDLGKALDEPMNIDDILELLDNMEKQPPEERLSE